MVASQSLVRLYIMLGEKVVNGFSTNPSLTLIISMYLFLWQVHAVIGVLGDDTDPMVTVMKLEKAPQETYADIGGLDQQIQEIKVRFTNFIAYTYEWAGRYVNKIK